MANADAHSMANAGAHSMANAGSYGQVNDTTLSPSGESLARLFSSSDPHVLGSNNAGLTNLHEQLLRSQSAHVAQSVRNAADAQQFYTCPRVSETQF